MLSRSIVRTLALLTLIVSGIVPGLPVFGQTKCTNASCQPLGTTALRFDGIAGRTVGVDGLLDVLEEALVLEFDVRRAVTIRFVYGIGDASDFTEVTGVTVSDPVLLVPGEAAAIRLGDGPVDSPWDAFDDPLLGFDDPLLGFDDPLLGFDDPLLGFDDPLVGVEEPLAILEDLWSGVEGIWGTGNVGLVMGIVLDDTDGASGAPLSSTAAIVPFDVAEATVATLKRSAVSAFETASSAPSQYALEGNYPNPFNPATTIRYALPEAAPVRLAVYDVAGREVAVLVDRTQAAGRYEASFRAEALPSGVYLYRLTAGAFAATGRMTLLK